MQRIKQQKENVNYNKYEAGPNHLIRQIFPRLDILRLGSFSVSLLIVFICFFWHKYNFQPLLRPFHKGILYR